ncbi:oligosaccharide flippase family protein [Caminibacter pacificus]
MTRIKKQIILSYLPRIVNFFVVPLQIALLTKTFSVEEYGVWSLLLSFGFIVTMIFTFGLQKLLGVKIPGKPYLIQLKYLKSILLAETVIYIVVSFVFVLIFLDHFLTLFNLAEYEDSFKTIVFIFLINLVYNEFGRFFNYTKRIELRIYSTVLEKILEFLLLYIAIKILNIQSINNLVYIYAFVYTFLLFVNLYFFRDLSLLLKIKINRKIIKLSFFFGLPLAFSDIAWKLIQNLDLYMLSYFDKKIELGIYSFISKLLNYVYLAGSPVIWVFYPYIAERYNKNGKELNRAIKHLVYNQTKFSLTLAVLAIGIVVINLEKIVNLIATSEYLNYTNAYFLYSFYPIILILLYINQQFVLLKGDTKNVGLSYFLGLSINFIGNLLLIPYAGIYGAIVASMVSIVSIIVLQAKAVNIFALIPLKLLAFVFIQYCFIYLLFSIDIAIFYKNLLFLSFFVFALFLLKIVYLNDLRIYWEKLWEKF